VTDTPINLAELERLAKAARESQPEWAAPLSPHPVSDYINAASPEVVIALIAALRAGSRWATLRRT
jgi:hypothetical protein